MFASIYASHTPLMRDGQVDAAIRGSVAAGFERLAARVRAFEPELVIQYSPDHFNGFLYDLMPAFCVGIAADSVGDWDTQAGPLPVPESAARDLADTILNAGIDTAVSYRMKVDHGFVQIWEQMFGKADGYPIIPIFINCAAPPLPTYRRARLLGEAVGTWARASGKRVLFAASGGLSHDPPLPDITTAAPEVRERIIAGRNPTPDQRRAHADRVLAAGEAAARGEGPCQPLNPEWDREMIKLMIAGDASAFDRLTTAGVREVGGRGGNEMLAWVAALASQSIGSPAAVTLEHYAAIDGWIAGMAMMWAQSHR